MPERCSAVEFQLKPSNNAFPLLKSPSASTFLCRRCGLQHTYVNALHRTSVPPCRFCGLRWQARAGAERCGDVVTHPRPPVDAPEVFVKSLAGHVPKPFISLDSKVRPHNCGDSCSFFSLSVDIEMFLQLLVVTKVLLFCSFFRMLSCGRSARNDWDCRNCRT